MLVALRLATQPLWFVGIYLGVAALAPMMVAAHRRWGAWVVVGLALAAVVVDGLRFSAGLTAVATLNYAFVWLALHQLGLCWYSGLLRARVAAVLVVVGVMVLVGCVSLGPYPVSLVGLPGEAISNMSPPTVALLAQGFALAGAAVLLRQPITRLLGRPRVWAAVVTAGAVTMTAFLWHLTALYLAVLGQRLLGIGRPEPATESWWLTRPLWLLVLALLTMGLIVVFRRFDSSRPPSGAMHPPRGADILTAVGASLAALGVLMVSVTGIDVVGSPAVRFVVVDTTPGVALATLAAGVVALALGRRNGVTPPATTN